MERGTQRVRRSPLARRMKWYEVDDSAGGFIEPRTDTLYLGYSAPDERICARDQRPRHPVLPSLLRGIYRYELANLYHASTDAYFS